MRLVSYASESGPRAAAVRGDGMYVDLAATDSNLPTSMRQLLAMGSAGWDTVAAATERGEPIDPASVRLLPPVPDPQKIICIGLNYADHAAETGARVGDEPIVFCKFPTALCAHQDEIYLPRVGANTDYEAELVAVIGREGKHIARKDALSHVAGYACGHDVSARDWQKAKPGKQWLLGKSFDRFAPLGPELVTADEIDDPHDLAIKLRLNGETMQDSSTRQLIFPVDYLVSYLSGVCTLLPGDLIYTGTPPGVGDARVPPVYLKPGDVVEVEIQGIGQLRNPVVAEPT
jgi:2-keto-4-pentenoate hydratase/2-oxohepta-3-ene-1,7-dioic acid hydratase in catechol pathway